MINVKIAFRNLIRNARRSLSIGLAIATGTAGLLCLGQFVGATLLDFQLTVVRANGHLSIFSKGYADFGAGNPAAFGIADYRAVERLVRRDPQLGPLVQYMTPRIQLFGIASNGKSDASATFFGVGLVPEDIGQMMLWDEYGRDLHPVGNQGQDVSAADPAAGVIGSGLARLLGLCAPLQVPNCPALPDRVDKASVDVAGGPPVDLLDLAGKEAPLTDDIASLTQVDLLTATASGAPNVAGMRVVRAEAQPVQALNDSYVRMNFHFAQRLLFGDEPKATAIVVQLRHGSDLARTKNLLSALFQKEGLDLEYRDYRELNPFYTQGEQFLQAIFLFFATISSIVVMFMIANTTSANVMERVGEIGTLRALGVQRGTIRLQFALEGAMLGALGATLGVILAEIVGVALNALNLKITIPGNSKPGPLEFLVGVEVLPMFAAVWAVVALVAVVAATLAAQRGAKLEVVEALRHV